jgi:hypothetical protein
VPRGTRGPGPESPILFRLRDYHTVSWAFPCPSATDRIGDFPTALQGRPTKPRNPDGTTLAGLHSTGLGFSRFARRYWGNLC